MAKHLIWAVVVLVVAGFAVIALGSPEQAKQVTTILCTGLGLGAFTFFIWMLR